MALICAHGSRSGAAHIGIALAFTPKAAFWAVARDKNSVIAHRPQPLGDAVNELLVVALRKVRAANAARKQHIPHKNAVNLGRIKHHMTRGVAGCVAHGKGLIANLHGIVVVQPARGGKQLRRRKTKAHTLLGQAINPKLIALMGANNGQLEALGQLANPPSMVDMAVGQPNLGECKATFFNLQ